MDGALCATMYSAATSSAAANGLHPATSASTRSPGLVGPAGAQDPYRGGFVGVCDGGDGPGGVIARGARGTAELAPR
jgi:hypothetical protein